MMTMRNLFPLLLFGAGVLLGTISCEHEPFLPEGADPELPDTTGTNPADTATNPVDTSNTGTPCDPNVVYFDQQVLPLLQSNCAKSGCHDAASAKEGVVLTSYEKVMQTGGIRAGDPGRSKLYKVLLDDDPEDRMPQAPNQPLTQAQIDLIAGWISQGAKNLQCDENAGSGGCNTANVKFAADIQPVLNTHCVGCHSGPSANAGIVLNTYAGVKATLNTGRLMGAIRREPGFVAMPYNGAKLNQCTIEKIQAWVDAGSPDN